jgi:UDP-N-acetylmuramoyl-tripeptide--D-alanyl-D-alanine ligase
MRARLLTFALVPGSDYVAEDIQSLGEAGMRFTLPGFPPLTVPVPGRHSVSNALAAIALARSLNATPEECARGLARTARLFGRMQVAKIAGVTLLLDHYNANPGSMDAGLDTLESWPGAKRRFAALGDMLELGAAGPSYHATIGRRLNRLDGAALWGPLMAHASEEAGAGRVKHYGTQAGDRVKLGEALASQLADGDVVLVKGSRGSAMEEVARVLEDRLAHRGGAAMAGEGR